MVLVMVVRSVMMSVSPAARAVPGKRNSARTMRANECFRCWDLLANAASFWRYFFMRPLLSPLVPRVLLAAGRSRQDQTEIFLPDRNTSRSAACPDVSVTTRSDRDAHGHRL